MAFILHTVRVCQEGVWKLCVSVVSNFLRLYSICTGGHIWTGPVRRLGMGEGFKQKELPANGGEKSRV